MRILLSGGTGFIGRALVPVLRREGHTVVVLTRSEAGARSRLGAEVDTLDVGAGPNALVAAIERCDAVVNLAGEPIFGGRWTAARCRKLWDSRIGLTEKLVQALASARQRPGVLISGSAVGYYGDRGAEQLFEESSPGQDYLARLCRGWESEARKAAALGLRVMILRTGVVLGRDGGALAKMLLPFRLGLGGPIGTGRQFMPWIHAHDLVQIIARALGDERFDGPINGVAPAPVTNREFTKTLGNALHRPAVCRVPGIALRAILGEAATVLLGSQRVEPAALGRLGFSFTFPTLDLALADIVGGSTVVVGPFSGTRDAGASERGQQYLERRRPTYELRTVTTVDAPLDEAFAFFSQAENLGMLTPAAMRFSIVGRAPAVGEDSTIEYRMRVGPVPITWRSRIVNWRPGDRFVDVQEKGPYRSWWHEHAFRSLGSSTVMEDRVCYAPPLGLLGRLVNRLFIAPALRSIFQYRADVIRLRFSTL